jgi:3,4-dihydroxy 2-butanone 4-phosphate synthase / GTP cyclohydrolase II
VKNLIHCFNQKSFAFFFKFIGENNMTKIKTHKLNTKKVLSSIPEVIDEIRKGKMIIVIDDEDRENEGDFVTAARNTTPDIINFMARYGRGLICVPLTETRCKELKLPLMVEQNINTSFHSTQFTVSVDLLGNGCTTGISAFDRAKTIQSLINSNTQAEDLARPGHIFPIMARDGGVLKRSGHTEAAVDLVRLAGFEPAGVLVEIMNNDGTMARLPDLIKIANEFQMRIVSIKDIITYRISQNL